MGQCHWEMVSSTILFYEQNQIFMMQSMMYKPNGLIEVGTLVHPRDQT
jgi:hypothetical protein